MVEKLLVIDPYLTPFKKDILLRKERYLETKNKLLGDLPRLSDFANAYLYYGFHRCPDGWVLGIISNPRLRRPR